MAVQGQTRQQMIDHARQLFAKHGVQNTTMNDIAEAAQKGRRTLYTYFKSKEEVFQAVVEQELEHVRRELEIARRLHLDVETKLINFIYIHLEAMKTVVLRNGTLKAEFFRDIWSVEQARQPLDSYELKMIQEILDEGVRLGQFEVLHTSTMAYLLHCAIKGMEVPYISGYVRQRQSSEYEHLRASVMHLIFNGIRKCSQSENR